MIASFLFNVTKKHTHLERIWSIRILPGNNITTWNIASYSSFLGELKLSKKRQVFIRKLWITTAWLKEKISERSPVFLHVFMQRYVVCNVILIRQGLLLFRCAAGYSAFFYSCYAIFLYWMSSLFSIMDPQHVANIVFTTFSMSSFLRQKGENDLCIVRKLNWNFLSLHFLFSSFKGIVFYTIFTEKTFERKKKLNQYKK